MGIPIGNFSDFLGGALAQQGHKQDLQDKADLAKQEEWNKVAPEKEILKAKAQYAAQAAADKKNQLNPNDTVGQQAQQFHSATGGFQYPESTPAPTTPSVPGVPSGMAQGNSITPQTPPLQGSTPAPAPTTQLAQGDATQAPQGQPAPASPDGLAPPPVSAIPPSAPAAQVIGQAQKAAATTPEDAYIASITDNKGQPLLALQEQTKAWKDAYGFNKDQLNALVIQRKNWQGTADAFQKDVVNPMVIANEKAQKNAPLDMSTMGSEDIAHHTAMKNLGIIGDKLAPLSTSQMKDNNKIIEAASNMKSAAETGITTFSRIVQDVSKINPGPGSDIAAYTKGAWAQMTGSQRSQALTTYFEGQKETTQALNNQINTMRAAGGRFVVGAKVLELEKQGIPDISKMPPEASLALAQSYINNYRQMIGAADAIMGGNENIPPAKRIQLSNAYAEQNPATGSDGQTSNPDFKTFTDWRDGVAAGKTHTGRTSSQNVSDIVANTSGALKDAKAGGKGEVPANNTAPKVLGTWNPKTGKIE